MVWNAFVIFTIMKRFKKALKMISVIIVAIICIAVLIVWLFVSFSPEMGGQATSVDIEKYKTSSNFKDGKFFNEVETNMDMSFKNGLKTMIQFIQGVKNGKPDFSIPVQQVDSLLLEQNKYESKLIWFGHSAFLLQIKGKNILIDPMFGDVPAPHPALGSRRYSDSLPIEIEQLPQIDVMIISHDHYDHLDYGSIQKLKNKTKLFYVPLGVGAHFEEWGVDSESITEFNWWDEQMLDGVEFAFTPARHFSGRGLSDRFSTLWGSWVIKSIDKSIFFSGDSGYGNHFKEIGNKFGPFDFAMIECGQYNDKWSEIHMTPEESAQAAIDVKTKIAMPIHWGAFTLSLHAWTDPVQRIIKKADELGLSLITPEIGELIRIDSTLQRSITYWWEN
jgi:L-ascorbate metabolism protein UlaG (beta-lactamase superfamily)